MAVTRAFAPTTVSSRERYLAALWAEHFPKHKTHPGSKLLCLTLCDILINEAQLNFPLAAPARRLEYILDTLRISNDQFHEIDVLARTLRRSARDS